VLSNSPTVDLLFFFGGYFNALRKIIATGNPRTEVIAWPSDSLPRRVKKLSWEDEYNVFF